MAMLFPIGGLLLLNNDSNPNEIYEGTQWELVSQDRYICGAGGKYTTGQQVEAGLPNITGKTNVTMGANTYTPTHEGALYGEIYDLVGTLTHPLNDCGFSNVRIDASKSNSIYGNSDTVTPSTLAVNIWQRIA